MIVGVVRDGRATSAPGRAATQVYVPYRQAPGLGPGHLLRAPGGPEALIQTLRRETVAWPFPGLALQFQDG